MGGLLCFARGEGVHISRRDKRDPPRLHYENNDLRGVDTSDHNYKQISRGDLIKLVEFT